MDVAGCHAIVTGAARGLGRCFALELLREGARVLAVDLNAAGLRSLRGEAATLPGTLAVAQADVTDEAAARDLVRQATVELGALDVLINNAGVLRDGVLVARDEDRCDGADGVRGLPLSQWSKVLDVNLTGPFLVTREVAASMIRRGTRGVIVNLSSLARTGNLGQSSYAASKAGLDACTRTWALELAPHGIRVGGVAPGVIDTPILGGIADDALATLRSGIPLGRFGTAEEVWQAVRFVLECEFFTGRTIEVDGGARLG